MTVKCFIEQFSEELTEEDKYYRKSVVEFSHRGNFHGAKPGNFRPEPTRRRKESSTGICTYPIDEVIRSRSMETMGQVPIQQICSRVRGEQELEEDEDEFIYAENAVLDHIHPAVEEYYLRKRRSK